VRATGWRDGRMSDPGQERISDAACFLVSLHKPTLAYLVGLACSRKTLSKQ